MNRINKKKVFIAIIIFIVIVICIIMIIIKSKKTDNISNVNVDDLREEIKVESIEEKTLDDYVTEFGGTKVGQPKSDMYYVSKDGLDYTIYSDGEIVEGNVIPWDGNSSEPARDEAGNYNIYSAQELKWIADKVISGEENFGGVTITLRKTIDLGARENEDGSWDGPVWNSIVGFLESEENTQEVVDDEPIDTENTNVIDENLKRFAGVFQAENATIRGMRIESDKNYQGLFGFSSGIVQNITIKNSYVKGLSSVGAIVGLNTGKVLNSSVVNTQVIGNDKIGGLVGTLSTGAFMEDSSVDEKTIIKSVAKYAGGICGYANNNSAINRCDFKGIVDGKEYVGGISGIAFFGIQIKNCKTQGATISGNNVVGGIVGYNKAQIDSSSNEKNENKATIIKGIGSVGGIVGINYVMGNIENVTSNAEIQVSGDNIGGIAGINNASITNAVFQGKLSIENESSLKVGGIVGENASDSYIYTSYSEGEVSNKKHAGGIYGANFGQIENCYYLEKTVKTDNVEDNEYAKSKLEYEKMKNNDENT